jgi:hypothetical protein
MTSAAWRKAILLNRSVVISAFGRAFPRHDFMSLRLVQAAPIIPWPNDADWAASAKNYHRDRREKERMR